MIFFNYRLNTAEINKWELNEEMEQNNKDEIFIQNCLYAKDCNPQLSYSI